MQLIDLQAQYQRIKPDVDARIQAVLDHGRYVMGPEVEALEARLAEYVGIEHCIALSSGTDALLVAMMALNIGPGDEVITTPFTFIATGEMIGLLGATPVFVDIDPDTYNIDAALIEEKITDRTKAIVPVSLFGQIADMDAINAVGERHHVPVIEDAAQSFGATYKGKRSCGVSQIAATSFFPAKPLGCYGDGGAAFTTDAALAERMRELRNHGQNAPYHHPRLGINGRLDTIQAAVLLAKMEVFDDEVARRAQVGARYGELLSGLVKTPALAADCTSVYAQYTIEVDDRERVRQSLNDAGIPNAVYYPVPLNRQPPLYSDVAIPKSERAAERVLSLPMHPYLEQADQDRVVDALKNAVKK
ncbi:superoxide dismutase Fe-Mn family protein [Salinisphaera shabanensis E1L3A]|uniref:Superoxide dismutase Fe-Mn family protein n=1 Tax=Salinisphaera shabanensis E1L3A TaxID=1033802 RepID=U2FVH5_9GAMM|nr:DegT/DnrJ/EryC1/StrS family aminotransferase [Salinisphaera shabanensis]ERJ18313.1 superoxide dismutase Fe-Mn family protein [Salinisphaera shabanensis E1L3A]